MNKQDIELLKIYTRGFNDELYDNEYCDNLSPLYFRAYNLGQDDFILGDDNPLVDAQTDEEILNKIYGE